jgi:hypothetical protein
MARVDEHVTPGGPDEEDLYQGDEDEADAALRVVQRKEALLASLTGDQEWPGVHR